MFHFDDGRSAKFWEIEVKGDSHVVRYGRLGTAGRTVAKQFTLKEDAKAAAAKLVRDKIKKGYREVTGTGAKPQQLAKRANPTTSRKGQGAGSTPPGTRLLDEAIYREAENKGAKVNAAPRAAEVRQALPRLHCRVLPEHYLAKEQGIRRDDRRLGAGLASASTGPFKRFHLESSRV